MVSGWVLINTIITCQKKIIWKYLTYFKIAVLFCIICEWIVIVLVVFNTVTCLADNLAKYQYISNINICFVSQSHFILIYDSFPYHFMLYKIIILLVYSFVVCLFPSIWDQRGRNFIWFFHHLICLSSKGSEHRHLESHISIYRIITWRVVRVHKYPTPSFPYW